MVMQATGAQPYIVSTPPATTPISLTDLKSWLKITTTDTSQDAILQLIIDRVVDQAQKFTKRVFITTGFTTYRDVFGDNGERPQYYGFPPAVYNGSTSRLNITLRRSPFQDVQSINYIDPEGNGNLLDTALYYTVFKESWSAIASVDQQPWPVVQNRQQAITIVFTAGYGDDPEDVPASLRNAMLAHAAYVYENRGDCDDPGSCDCEKTAPGPAMSVYRQYRIIDFVL